MNDIKLTAPQLQLRQTRKEIRALAIGLQTNSFPRSMTMKLLMSTGGQRVLTQLLGSMYNRKAMTSRFSGFLRSVAMSALMKMVWSRIVKR